VFIPVPPASTVACRQAKITAAPSCAHNAIIPACRHARRRATRRFRRYAGTPLSSRLPVLNTKHV